MDFINYTDEQLIEMSTLMAIDVIKGKKVPMAKLVNEELKKRGIKVEVTKDLINKVLTNFNG